MFMLLTSQCSQGSVTTKELNAAMDEALKNGWTPPPSPESAPLPVADPNNATIRVYLSSA
jgi:hypothetical protein